MPTLHLHRSGRGGTPVSLLVPIEEGAGAGIEPPLTLRDQFANRIFRERSGVLLAELKLHLQPALMSHLYHVVRRQRHVGETFSTFNAGYTDIGA